MMEEYEEDFNDNAEDKSYSEDDPQRLLEDEDEISGGEEGFMKGAEEDAYAEDEEKKSEEEE